MDKLEMTLHDFFSCECPYRGCSYNRDGGCANDSKYLVKEIFDLVFDFYPNFDVTFDCSYANIEPGVCPRCGEEYKIIREPRGEFWGAPCYEEMKVCGCY